MIQRTVLGKLLYLVIVVSMLGCGVSQRVVDIVEEPYLLDTGLTSRSISFENPTGAPGQGGKAASKLGVGRKGSPAITLKAGQEVQLCDIEGAGTIRHIWMTTSNYPVNLRSLVIRAWWDNQKHPSIECPVGDFMGFAHGKVMAYYSAVHSLGKNAGMNIWLPMPFVERARIALTNEGEKDVPLFYQIDYTIGEGPHFAGFPFCKKSQNGGPAKRWRNGNPDRHPRDVGRLHVLFRRENPTTMKKDFVLLPHRKNKGRFMGTVIGIRNLTPGQWWGEGEIKVYMDGDTDFPTICGTGSEDYVGLSYGMQQTPYLYNGCSLNQKNFVSMYRWHLPDPVSWREECRITIQQISWKNGLAETQDDWSCATFWYEPVPSAALPKMPEARARTADIWQD